ncbi:MAG: hypothetical protein ACYDEA_09425 [Candidatus Dormibacteria bacterium]
MIRAPFMAVAILMAGLMAACGSTSVQHPAPSGSTPSPSAKAPGSGKATPTPTAKPMSATAQAEAGFVNWAKAAVILTGGGPAGMPVASAPAAEMDVYHVLGSAFKAPGWLTALGHAEPLVEIPPGCMESTTKHVVGAFPVPATAPAPAGAGAVALVIRGAGACHTEAGGQVFEAIPAGSAPATWVLLGSLVPLPPVPGLPGLPTSVWTPVFEGNCQSDFVLEAGAQFPSGVVPGC